MSVYMCFSGWASLIAYNLSFLNLSIMWPCLYLSQTLTTGTETFQRNIKPEAEFAMEKFS